MISTEMVDIIFKLGEKLKDHGSWYGHSIITENNDYAYSFVGNKFTLFLNNYYSTTILDFFVFNKNASFIPIRCTSAEDRVSYINFAYRSKVIINHTKFDLIKNPKLSDEEKFKNILIGETYINDVYDFNDYISTKPNHTDILKIILRKDIDDIKPDEIIQVLNMIYNKIE